MNTSAHDRKLDVAHLRMVHSVLLATSLGALFVTNRKNVEAQSLHRDLLQLRQDMAILATVNDPFPIYKLITNEALASTIDYKEIARSFVSMQLSNELAPLARIIDTHGVRFDQLITCETNIDDLQRTFSLGEPGSLEDHERYAQRYTWFFQLPAGLGARVIHDAKLDELLLAANNGQVTSVNFNAENFGIDTAFMYIDEHFSVEDLIGIGEDDESDGDIFVHLRRRTGVDRTLHIASCRFVKIVLKRRLPEGWIRLRYPGLNDAWSTIRHLSLGEAMDYADALQRDDQRSVELLGLKLPADRLAWAAPLVILGTLLYLLMYVSDASQYAANARLPDERWIGLAIGKLPLLATAATTMVAPACSIFVVTNNLTGRTFLAAALSIVSVLVSINMLLKLRVLRSKTQAQ